MGISLLFLVYFRPHAWRRFSKTGVLFFFINVAFGGIILLFWTFLPPPGMLYKNGSNILSVTSAYRSYSYQKQLFDNDVNSLLEKNPGMSKSEAEARVATYLNRPGTSEHQSGLCCDMHNYSAASTSNGMCEKFAESDVGVWLVNNCYKFGFVLRYPKDKVDVTGIKWESWHFRYVGRYHATRMHELGLCLEEYLDYLNAQSK